MTITPQSGDVWERDGVRFRILKVESIFVTLNEIGKDGEVQRWMLYEWQLSPAVYKLIERDGKAVPHE